MGYEQFMNASAPGLSAGGDIISTLIASKVARENTNKTISANKAMAQYAYSRDLDMWNRANEYNLPANQMARLKAGGLNPQMAMAGGSVGGNVVSSSIPKFQAPRQDYNYLPPIDPGSALQAFNDMRMKNAQIDYIKEQERASKANADKQEYRNVLESQLSKYAIRRGRQIYGIGEANLNLKELEAGLKTWEMTGQMQNKYGDFSRSPAIQKFQYTNSLLDYQNQIMAKNAEYWMWKNLYFPGAKIGIDALGNIAKIVGHFLPIGKAFKAGGNLTPYNRSVMPGRPSYKGSTMYQYRGQ